MFENPHQNIYHGSDASTHITTDHQTLYSLECLTTEELSSLMRPLSYTTQNADIQ
jgi:hypothetical protein